MELPGPIEFLELAPGESRTFTVLSFEEGETTIRTATSPGGKVIPLMRVHVTPESKPAPPNYYDVSGVTLQHQLRPVLSGPGATPRRLTVTKVGSGPSARFTLEVAPAQGSPV